MTVTTTYVSRDSYATISTMKHATVTCHDTHSRRPLTMKAQVYSQASQRGISGAQNVNGIGYSPSTSLTSATERIIN